GWEQSSACSASMESGRCRGSHRPVGNCRAITFEICWLGATERYGLARQKGSLVGRLASSPTIQDSLGSFWVRSFRIAGELFGLPPSVPAGSAPSGQERRSARARGVLARVS